MVISKIYQVPEDEFRKIVDNAITISDCLEEIGYIRNKRGQFHGETFTIFKKRCDELGIDVERFRKNKTIRAQSKTKLPIETILVENSKYVNIARLKDRLIKEGLKEYKCEICGNLGIWQSKPLSLELHHINGNHFDHRLENLQFLCANCHSQEHVNDGR